MILTYHHLAQPRWLSHLSATWVILRNTHTLYRIIVTIGSMFQKRGDVDNPLYSLLLMGSSSQSDNAPWLIMFCCTWISIWCTRDLSSSWCSSWCKRKHTKNPMTQWHNDLGIECSDNTLWAGGQFEWDRCFRDVLIRLFKWASHTFVGALELVILPWSS